MKQAHEFAFRKVSSYPPAAMAGPLEGIRVIDLTAMVSGPLAICVLAVLAEAGFAPDEIEGLRAEGVLG